MVERASGHVLVMTGWSDEAVMHSEQASDGMERTTIAEHVGLRIYAVQHLEVVAMHEIEPIEATRTHWVRVTWVEGVPASRMSGLAELHDEKVSEQAASGDLRASYWLADPATGDGVAFSMWDTAAGIAVSEPDSNRRRRSFQDEFGCRIAMVATYEALGVVLPSTPDPSTPGLTREPGGLMAEVGSDATAPEGDRRGRRPMPQAEAQRFWT